MSDDIANLTLRVLERIQAELVGMRGDLAEVKTELVEVKGEIRIFNTRFDHFLSFVGRDVQDLKSRVSVLEDRVGIPRP